MNATLTVSREPVIDRNARDVTVRLTDRWGEVFFRNSAWVESNRAYVKKQSGGKIGYVYVVNSHVNGSREFMRQFQQHLDDEALIIDSRWNMGGHLPLHMIEVLSRQTYAYTVFSRKPAGGTPRYMHAGPKCLLINGVNVSGGDELPVFFRKRGLGRIVGTTTSGGMLGVGGIRISYVDGSSSGLPHVGFQDESGRWVVEGHGVEPDITVIDDPALTSQGIDPQLDRAIQLLLSEIRAATSRTGVGAPARPATPP